MLLSHWGLYRLHGNGYFPRVWPCILSNLIQNTVLIARIRKQWNMSTILVCFYNATCHNWKSCTCLTPNCFKYSNIVHPAMSHLSNYTANFRKAFDTPGLLTLKGKPHRYQSFPMLTPPLWNIPQIWKRKHFTGQLILRKSCILKTVLYLWCNI